MINEEARSRLESVIWDFDGTIVDTETPAFQAWQAIFVKAGAHLDPLDWGLIVGTVGGVDLFDRLETQVGAVDRVALDQERRALQRRYLASSPLRTGVQDLLDALVQAHVPCAVATSSSRWWVERFLTQHQIRDKFLALATADDVRHVKPDPEVYRLALRQLGAAGPRSVAIEDSPHGAQAALAAGIPCLVVANPSTSHLRFPPGVHRMDSLTRVTVDDLSRMSVGESTTERR